MTLLITSRLVIIEFHINYVNKYCLSFVFYFVFYCVTDIWKITVNLYIFKQQNKANRNRIFKLMFKTIYSLISILDLECLFARFMSL